MLMNADVSQAGHAVVMADIPDPEVAPRAQARTFAPSYKARILAEFEALPKAAQAHRAAASKSPAKTPKK